MSRDFTFLAEASKRLHGYLVHTWFMHYLGLLTASLQRWMDRGWIDNDGQPASDDAAAFDFAAIDLEKITYIVGFYLYIYSSHKKANFTLLQDGETKRLLYLRGFDYEGATRTGGPTAIGYSSVDTGRFSLRLADALRADFEIFTALSPRDLFWQTTAPNYFYGDYDRLIRISSNPIRSFHLNANHWQEDVAELVDRMDGFVVYVSSITASVLWELDLLQAKGRARHTVVVFDEEAIANKEIQTGMQERMQELHGNGVLWAKDLTTTPDLTAAELRASLAQRFVVVSPDEFFAGIEEHGTRWRNAEPASASRHQQFTLPFRFHPAVNSEALREIEDFHAAVETTIRRQIESQAIANLPLFLNNVQLRIFTSLMVGRHSETGRALAIYGAVMSVVQKHLFGAPRNKTETGARETLLDHHHMAGYASPRLMALGQTHEFGDYSDAAWRTYDEVFAAASEAVETFFRAGRSRGR